MKVYLEQGPPPAAQQKTTSGLIETTPTLQAASSNLVPKNSKLTQSSVMSSQPGLNPRNNPYLLKVFHPTTYFGEVGIIMKKDDRGSFAYASQDCHLMILSKTEFESIVREEYPLYYKEFTDVALDRYEKDVAVIQKHKKIQAGFGRSRPFVPNKNGNMNGMTPELAKKMALNKHELYKLSVDRFPIERVFDEIKVSRPKNDESRQGTKSSLNQSKLDASSGSSILDEDEICSVKLEFLLDELKDCQLNLQQKIEEDEKVKDTIKQKLEKESKALNQPDPTVKLGQLSGATNKQQKDLRSVENMLEGLQARLDTGQQLDDLEGQLRELLTMADSMGESTAALHRRVQGLGAAFVRGKDQK